MSPKKALKRKGKAQSWYVLILDDQRIYVSYSRNQCMEKSTQVLKSNVDGKELQMVSEMPVANERDRLLYFWRNDRGWKLQRPA